MGIGSRYRLVSIVKEEMGMLVDFLALVVPAAALVVDNRPEVRDLVAMDQAKVLHPALVMPLITTTLETVMQRHMLIPSVVAVDMAQMVVAVAVPCWICVCRCQSLTCFYHANLYMDPNPLSVEWVPYNFY